MENPKNGFNTHPYLSIMATEPNDPATAKWQAYLLIAAGVFLLLVRFMKPNPNWTTVDWLKAGVSVTLIVFGLGKLVKKRSGKN